jgi:hypothetical protein
VGDWDSRFRLAGYSAEQQRLVRLSQDKMAEWMAMRGAADWTEQENAKDGLMCWYRTSARGLNTFKCARVLPAPVLDVFRTLLDGAYRQDYDENVVETEFLKKFCENIFCLYQRSKKVIVVSPREFLLINYNHKVSRFIELSTHNLCSIRTVTCQLWFSQMTQFNPLNLSTIIQSADGFTAEDGTSKKSLSGRRGRRC